MPDLTQRFPMFLSPHGRKKLPHVPPSDLPVTAGLRGWWKADGITAPPADGSSLTSWTDSSSGGHPLASSGAPPTYRTTGAFLPNSKPVAEFTEASSTRMDASVSTSAAAITRLAVIRAKTLTGTNAGHTIVSGGTGGFQYGVRSEGNLSSSLEGNKYLIDTTQAQGQIVVGNWYIVTMTDDGTVTNTIYVNSTQYAQATRTSEASVGTTTVIGSTEVGSSYFDGYLAEVVDYNRVLNSTELGQVNSYLATKYGITLSDGGGGAAFLDLAWDTSENQALGHTDSSWENGTGSSKTNTTHQRAWLTTTTRLGVGHSERFECHNNTGDRWPGNTTYRSLMAVADTNDGGITAGSAVGYPEVYWAWSSYLPTNAVDPTNATVSSGYSQTQIPDYEHLWEIHERMFDNINGISDLNEVSNHAVMLRNGNLEYRERCGQFTWNGSSWTKPSYNTVTPGTNGSNDQIPIPIVKPGSTSATYPMNVWVDVIVHIRFRTDSTGLTEIWARQSGQTFTTSANLSITGPTHKVFTGSDSVTRTTENYGASGTLTGCYLEVGLYTGSSSWDDASSGAHVQIMDELRRYDTLAAAKANWG